MSSMWVVHSPQFDQPDSGRKQGARIWTILRFFRLRLAVMQIFELWTRSGGPLSGWPKFA